MHVVVGLLPCMLLVDVTCLHVERNMLVGASYLDIEDYRASMVMLLTVPRL